MDHLTTQQDSVFSPESDANEGVPIYDGKPPDLFAMLRRKLNNVVPIPQTTYLRHSTCVFTGHWGYGTSYSDFLRDVVAPSVKGFMLSLQVNADKCPVL